VALLSQYPEEKRSSEIGNQ